MTTSSPNSILHCGTRVGKGMRYLCNTKVKPDFSKIAVMDENVNCKRCRKKMEIIEVAFKW